MMLVRSPELLTYDACIRAPLISWLLAQHPDDGSTELIQEFKMPRPSARIDMALVNGELAGFEIKSDADTLTRLQVQIPAFSRFFDRVSLVTTKKHLAGVRRRVPVWWGIILHLGGDDFRVARKSRRNPQVDVESLLHSLSVKEIIDLAHRGGLSTPKGKKDALVTHVASTATYDVISHHARNIIRQRVRTIRRHHP